MEKRRELLQMYDKYGVVAYLSGHAHRTIIKEYMDIQLVTGATTSINFEDDHMGFRLWQIGSTRPYSHELIGVT